MSSYSQQLIITFCIILLVLPFTLAEPVQIQHDVTSQPITGGFNAANIIYGSGQFNLSGFSAGGTGPVGNGTIIVYQNGIFIATGTFYNKNSFQQLLVLIQQVLWVFQQFISN